MFQNMAFHNLCVNMYILYMNIRKIFYAIIINILVAFNSQQLYLY